MPAQAPAFFLQIVDPDGVVVRLPGGGMLERNLIAACTDAIVKRGVGMLRGEAHVRTAIQDGLREVIGSLKAETRRVV